LADTPAQLSPPTSSVHARVRQKKYPSNSWEANRQMIQTLSDTPFLRAGFPVELRIVETGHQLACRLAVLFGDPDNSFQKDLLTEGTRSKFFQMRVD